MMEQHFCHGDSECDYDHGNAICFCLSLKSGKMLASIGEYSSFVNFCPYCGKKAEVPAKIEPMEQEQQEYYIRMYGNRND